ncbi:enoyl-ACP reductase FabI [Jatrophihabitans lederbergiae]|uniref:Enoyl-[acyl-carrier-protein] reductase [NADH] n=1 Tax=Jatrophihabitans lederbergiae TaxID=3075547 RepID=A0ABU2JAX1_9ACTN|nr:enoyl-ACP reductase FabI [Jatrophihabitans sp. DSM 44399]MDT0262136.1 enoyl-ACP reductase FabI [Jatrophihabitans sp. DSM 44399]
MLLADKRLLVTGVLNERSIAYAAAELALQQGAEVVLTGFGRGLRLTERFAERLSPNCQVLEMDATRPDHLDTVADWCDKRWGKLDGVLHSIAFAPATTLDGGFLSAPWPEVAQAFEVSTYTFAAFGRTFGPLLAQAGGGSLVGLDFDAGQAWPGYDWMGVAKAGLEGCCRYLANALGPAGTRVNLIAAGPLRTIAASAIGAFDGFEHAWAARAPLGWDVRDPYPVGRAVCALWSDWLPAVSGEVLHVDGGMHAIGGGTVAIRQQQAGGAAAPAQAAV